MDDASSDQYDIFGKIDGVKKLERGWLTDDVAIYLRLSPNAIQWLSDDALPKQVPTRKSLAIIQ
jgi:hypothetical protein